jgi:hypothetical protein
MSKERSVAIRRQEIAESTRRLAGLNRRLDEAAQQQSDEYASARSAFLGLYDHLAFPGGLAQKLQALTEQHPEAVEDAICFLEVDPWFFGSGYIKERILHNLKRCSMTETQHERLMQCILRSIDGGSRRVFASYARVAGAHPSNALRMAVESRLASADPEVKRRAWHVMAVIRSRSGVGNPER